MSNIDEKPLLRVISVAWGRKYVDEFLNYCLPALLSRGNLPVLTEHFSCTLVLVTESRFFSRIQSNEAFPHLTQVCQVRLVELDDLIARSDAYGMSLTYALYRGFEDLGDAMTNCYMLFLNSDFILSADSYRGLLPYLLRGDRLILAPSYCVNAEDVLPQLCAARDLVHGVIAIPERKLAEIILSNRHVAIRTKTINQKIYSNVYIDQFYFALNESTLLGHQFPVAVVAMRPEKKPLAINSYWDYGLIAEFCPSNIITVIGDSDEFLMMELRERNRGGREVSLGWPPHKVIAKNLQNIVTSYTANVGLQPLTLHSGSISDVECEYGRTTLRDFVEHVLLYLRPFRDHDDHPQWNIHFERFQQAREKFLEKRKWALGYSQESGLRSLFFEVKEKQIDSSKAIVNPEELEKLIRELLLNQDVLSSFLKTTVVSSKIFYHLVDIRDKIAARTDAATSATEQLMLKLETCSKNNFSKIDFEQINLVNLEEEILELTELIHDYEATISSIELVISQFLRYELSACRGALAKLQSEYKIRVEKQTRIQEIKKLNLAPNAGLSVSLWRFLFGTPPNYKPWHWLFSATRRPLRVVKKLLIGSPRIVHILSENSVGVFTQNFSLSPAVTLKSTDCFGDKLVQTRPFDLCIVEGSTADIPDLKNIFDRIRPFMVSGGDFVAYFLNSNATRIPIGENSFDFKALPICGPMNVLTSGGTLAVAGMKVKLAIEKGLTRLNLIPRSVAGAISICSAAPIVVLGSILELVRRYDVCNWTKPVAAVTVIIRTG